MHERLRKIRRMEDLTQEEFGKRVGVKRNTIAQYEMGRNEPIDSVIALICKEFSINEEWLRYGKGEIYKPKTIKEELVDLTDKLLSEESTSFKNRLISALAKLTEEQWDVLEKVIDDISQKKD